MILINFVLTILLLLRPGVSFAIECDGAPPSGPENEASIKEYIQKCSEKVSNLQKEQSSLSQAISTINSKINLAQGQINQTLSQIESLQKEIGVLGGVLDKVNESVGELTKIYLARVKESYRKSRVDQSNLIFSNSSFGEYFAKLRYLNIIKSKDQIILSELENSRKDYDSRRQSKLEKQKEIESLKIKMEAQKKVLDAQQKEKKNLLTITANDEKKYQAMRKSAEAQLAALKRFVVSQGGASILQNQTTCDGWGCYYNQRDSQWGNLGLGISKYSVAESGCLVSSVSMMASHAGKNIKPGDIASNVSAIDAFGLLKHSFQVNGVNVSISPYQNSSHNEVIAKLDSELGSGRSVIAGMYSGPDHFIVIVKKEGDKYIMHDPFLENGGNHQFLDKYSLSDINSLRLVSFN